MPGNNVVDAGDFEERSPNRIFPGNQIYNGKSGSAETSFRAQVSGFSMEVQGVAFDEGIKLSRRRFQGTDETPQDRLVKPGSVLRSYSMHPPFAYPSLSGLLLMRNH